MLDVSGNKFGDEGACAFIKSLHKVYNLVMENCAVTKDGFLTFKEAYTNKDNKVCKALSN